MRRSFFHSRSSLWNKLELLRKFHNLPKLIFLNIKVVVSHTHEFHPKLKTRNRQLNRYMKLIFSESPSKTVLYLRSLIDLHIKPRRTVRLSGKLIAVNRPPARCEDVIFVTSTFHMSMESSFETQFKVVLLKTDPEHHFPDPHSFQLSNRTDNLKL